MDTGHVQTGVTLVGTRGVTARCVRGSVRLQMTSGLQETAQQLKAPLARLENLSSIPRTHVGEGENQLLRAVLDLQVYPVAHITHTN